jgi:hypothetical protein
VLLGQDQFVETGDPQTVALAAVHDVDFVMFTEQALAADAWRFSPSRFLAGRQIASLIEQTSVKCGSNRVFDGLHDLLDYIRVA